MLVKRIDGSDWLMMTSEEKLEVVGCYEQDLIDAAARAGTSVPQQEVQFVAWLDDAFEQGHIGYYTGRVDGVLVTLLRTHDDEVPGELLIEGLQTVSAHQGTGLARQLLLRVLTEAPGRYCADVDRANLASRATLNSVGFHQTPGRTPNHHRWRTSTT